jgi:hypothetical protein
VNRALVHAALVTVNANQVPVLGTIVPGPHPSLSVPDGSKVEFPGLNKSFGLESFVKGREEVLFHACILAQPGINFKHFQK